MKKIGKAVLIKQEQFNLFLAAENYAEKVLDYNKKKEEWTVYKTDWHKCLKQRDHRPCFNFEMPGWFNPERICNYCKDANDARWRYWSAASKKGHALRRLLKAFSDLKGD